MASSSPTSPLPRSEQAPAISRLLTRAYTTHTGRGPESVRTHVAPGVVTVVLRNCLTRAEQVIRHEEQRTVEMTRRALQVAMRRELTNGVAAITGLRVEAFLSDHDVDTDVAVEVFILASGGAHPPAP